MKEQHIKEPAQCRELLIESIKEQMDVGETAYEFEHGQSVILVIGVNGVGKTTSVGKLAGFSLYTPGNSLSIILFIFFSSSIRFFLRNSIRLNL